MTTPPRQRWVLYVVTFLALVLTIPWFFLSPSGDGWFGLPGWAAYTVAATILYAVLIAWCLGACWELSAGADPGPTGIPRRPEDHRR